MLRGWVSVRLCGVAVGLQVQPINAKFNALCASPTMQDAAESTVASGSAGRTYSLQSLQYGVRMGTAPIGSEAAARPKGHHLSPDTSLGA